ncbi:immunoglobulin-like domain-containing protein [Alteribacillus bidgolensis]|uniref:Bacterial Ig-like domain-containing protein n=1 Tax=Alteribacillus bidgolensis TaxID=930129 RepID=A0A1G8RC47_9BACI|nr:immunoglobulin-like domain-containing protein [Alteribacillus bidgolensis]SDJ14557.1 hypothetical protein SAMN05216352_12619 [Alteribacillus bidgolensis]
MMWKKTIPFLLAILLLTACSADAEGKSRDVLSPMNVDGVSWETEKETYTSSEVISLSLKNETSHVISFGTPYAVERYEDGKWVKTSLTENLHFTQQLITLQPGETYQTTVDLNAFEDKISPGIYQVVKNIDINGEKFKIGAAFQIVETSRNDECKVCVFLNI